jgi:hypothetical protein
MTYTTYAIAVQIQASYTLKHGVDGQLIDFYTKASPVVDELGNADLLEINDITLVVQSVNSLSGVYKISCRILANHSDAHLPAEYLEDQIRAVLIWKVTDRRHKRIEHRMRLEEDMKFQKMAQLHQLYHPYSQIDKEFGTKNRLKYTPSKKY